MVVRFNLFVALRILALTEVIAFIISFRLVNRFGGIRNRTLVIDWVSKFADERKKIFMNDRHLKVARYVKREMKCALNYQWRGLIYVCMAV